MSYNNKCVKWSHASSTRQILEFLNLTQPVSPAVSQRQTGLIKMNVDVLKVSLPW
jgi:hypothetical protein